MYKVIVVDDEPVALNHVCTIIEKKCPEFEIMGRAENGREALALLKQKRADVVVSDIQMPVMNGLELAEMIKEEYPDIITVIVSGYQDFEYAKGALKSGVSDYILKPVMPSEMEETFARIEDKLQEKYYKERNEIMKKICRGIMVEEQEMKSCFSSERYYGAVVRLNGLPRRFMQGKGREIFSDINEMMFVYGRDEMEALYICPEEIVFQKDFTKLISEKIAKEHPVASYRTIVVKQNPFLVKEMEEVIKSLYRIIDKKTILGKSQVLLAEDVCGAGCEKKEGKQQLLTELERLAEKHKYEQLRKEVKSLLVTWQQEERSLLWIEGMIRQIYYLMQRFDNTDENVDDYEFLQEEVFFYSENTEEFIENILQILFRDKKEELCNQTKVDTGAFFGKIRDYMNRHLADTMTLSMVCREFGVSQTYLSRLFRKYEDTSFNNYLTSLRMERAKQLMMKNEKMFVKDIALQVGYGDQFYFSRIFRSYTGECPSDFMEK